MYWYSNFRKISIGALTVLLWMQMSCMGPEKSANFETDLISLTQILDSVFQNGQQDSIRTVTKTISLRQGKQESREIENYNIQNDLEILRDYDVATPRWADFVLTSTQDSAGYSLIHYTLDNSQAPVKRISFTKKGNNLERLQVWSHKKSMVSEQKMMIDWALGDQYTLSNESKLIFRNPSTFHMKVDY